MAPKVKMLFLLILSFPILHAQMWKPLGPIGSDRYNMKNSAWAGGTGQICGFAFAPRGDGSGQYDLSLIHI